MAYYDQRTAQLAETRNFGGLNRSASIVEVRDGEARDLMNVEVDAGGAVVPRQGFTALNTGYTDPQHLTFYTTSSGEIRYVMVHGAYIKQASSIDGAWTDITNGISIVASTSPWTSVAAFGRLFLANPDNQPICIEDYAGASTLKDRSLIQPPQITDIAFVGTYSGAGGVARDLVRYAITFMTARGETTPGPTVALAAGTNVDNPGSAGSSYLSVSWLNRLGIGGVRLYRFYSAYQLQFLREFGPNISSYSDQSDYTDITALGSYAPTTNTAYNTPEDWETNGAPEIVTVIAKGRNARLMFCRGNKMWFSALNNPFDYHSPNDAFDRVLLGGDDNRIKAVAPLYDYTVIYTNTNAFFFTGNTPSDFAQDRMIAIGCSSPNSLISVGNDAMCWTQYGPAAVSRIQAGAEIEAKQATQKVQDDVNALDTDTWPTIVGLHDVRNRRALWFHTPASGTPQNEALVWCYQISAWTKFRGMPVKTAFLDPGTRYCYALLTNGTLARLFEGDSDGGTAIEWWYSTGWTDMRTNFDKWLTWVEVIVHHQGQQYNMDVELDWDFEKATVGPVALTRTTTDGLTIEEVSGLVTRHRVDMEGQGKFFSLTFSGTSATGRPRIVSWRPEARLGGLGQ